MKKLFFYALAAVLTLGALNSCKKEEGAAPIRLISGSTDQTIWANKNTGNSTVEFKTTGAWTSSITAGATWLTINPSSGSVASNYRITLTLTNNYTGADRTAVITLTSGGESIGITVTQKATTESGQTPGQVTGLTLDKTDTTLTVGETTTLIATVIPQDATTKWVTWSSSDETVATVDRTGLVTAVAPGTATITVVSGENEAIKAECEVTVRGIPVTGLTLNKADTTLTLNETAALIATVAPGNATNPQLIWSSSDKAIVTVDWTGRIEALAWGTATITVVSAENEEEIKATCTVTVDPLSVMIAGTRWATRNVGALGRFVENPWDYGGYFNFTMEQTVCPDGWRMPTKEEFQNLIDTGYTWTTPNDVNGQQFGGGTNSIFLPAAGYYFTVSDKVVAQGWTGSYWSSTAINSSAVNFLSFNSTVASQQYSDSASGYSVRCVRE